MDLKTLVLRTVIAIRTDKIHRKVEPSHALMQEIIRKSNDVEPHHPDEIKAALRELCREKKLRWGVTINDTYFFE